MATSFLQKLKLGIRGWNRRRAEESSKRAAEFLARETSWASRPTSPVMTPTSGVSPQARFDLEGLQVAFLDDSGRIEHYLDVETGEVLEFPMSDAEQKQLMDGSRDRYRRIPTRTSESEAQDREAFLFTVDKPSVRTSLEQALKSGDPAGEFRRALAGDWAVERSWYNFKNRRAAEAIDRWLKEVGS